MVDLAKARLPLAAAAISVLLAACGSTAAGGTGASSSSKSAGAPLHSQVPHQYLSGLTVAATEGDPPFSYLSPSGVVTGFDPDLDRALAAELGIPVNIHLETFENALLGVQQGRFDLAGATNVSTQREQVYSFFTTLTDADTFGTLSNKQVGGTPMAICGNSISIESGDESIPIMQGWSKNCTASNKPAISVKVFPTNASAETAVQSGRVDLYAVDEYSLLTIPKPAGQTWKAVGFKFVPTYVGDPMPKDSSLAPVLLKAMNILIKNGTYARLLKKYGMATGAVKTSALNPVPLPSDKTLPLTSTATSS